MTIYYSGRRLRCFGRLSYFAVYLSVVFKRHLLSFIASLPPACRSRGTFGSCLTVEIKRARIFPLLSMMAFPFILDILENRVFTRRTSSTSTHPLLCFISCGRYFCGMLGVKPAQSWGDLVRQTCSQASVTQKTRIRFDFGRMDTSAPVSTSWSSVPCLMLSWLFLAQVTSACPGRCWCCILQQHILTAMSFEPTLQPIDLILVAQPALKKLHYNAP